MAKVPGEGGGDPLEVAVTLAGAAALGGDFPPSVPDTPENRRLFEEIKARTDALPEGTAVDLPFDP